jgi:hypothetical protein
VRCGGRSSRHRDPRGTSGLLLTERSVI